MDAPYGSEIPPTLTCTGRDCGRTFDFHDDGIAAQPNAVGTHWRWDCPKCGHTNETWGYNVQPGGDIPL